MIYLAYLIKIIHTDGASNLQLGLGLMEASGIIDFYPNGGRDQTGCASLPDKVLTGLVNIVTSNIDDLEDVSGCSHVSAYKFFTDSIENANCYRAYPCSSFSEFKNGNCLNCINARCNQMGYWASKNKGTGSLYLVTQVRDLYFDLKALNEMYYNTTPTTSFFDNIFLSNITCFLKYVEFKSK